MRSGWSGLAAFELHQDRVARHETDQAVDHECDQQQREQRQQQSSDKVVGHDDSCGLERCGDARIRRRPNGIDAGRIMERSARAEAISAELLAEAIERLPIVEEQVRLIFINDFVDLAVELGPLLAVEFFDGLSE